MAEVFGALAVARLRLRNLARTAVLAWALLGAFRFPLGLAASPLLAAGLLAVTGFASALTDIPLIALVQQRIPDRHLAKALGLWEGGHRRRPRARPGDRHGDHRPRRRQHRLHALRRRPDRDLRDRLIASRGRCGTPALYFAFDIGGLTTMPSQDASHLFGQDHVRSYRETDGEIGHDWKGTTTLLLTTIGRWSGEPRATPVIYGPGATTTS